MISFLEILRDKKITRKFIIQNLMVWAIILLAFLSISFFVNGYVFGPQGFDVLLGTLFFFFIFYANFFCFVLFLGRNKLLFSVLVLLLYFLVFLFVYHDASNTYLTNPSARDYKTESNYIFVQIYIFTIYYIILFFISFAYWAIRNSNIRKAENLKKESKLIASNLELQAQQENLRTQLLLSENNFLRAQINPHFLYNSLNLLYSHTRTALPEVGNAIMMLSQIMRYSITDFSARNGMADLDSEIEHLQNVITLNKFRYDNKIDFEFTCEGNFKDKLIAPMILVTLVENIFKHGDLQKHKAKVVASIEEAKKKLHFTTSNVTTNIEKSSFSGMGLTNIEQRLKLLYPGNYSLNIKNEGAIFITEMSMPYFEN